MQRALCCGVPMQACSRPSAVEFRVMEAVATHGVPVPKMYWLENDGSALDRPFS
jgi:aminoglycoside phosphotransferase (APT) family kinase protein